jgi:hypothetical protein
MSNPIMATQGCPSTTQSDSYRFISTIEVVQALSASGWDVEQTKVAKTRRTFVGTDPVSGERLFRESPKSGYQKHRVVFGRSDAKLPEVGGAKAQLILTNDHSGGGAFVIKIGLFRFVCANGLSVGTGIESMVRFTHRSKLSTLEFGVKVFEEVARLEREFIMRVMPQVEAMRAKNLDSVQTIALATDIVTRLNITPESIFDLVRSQREEDNEPDVFTVMNRIQEHLQRGGYLKSGAVRRTRATTNMKKADKINDVVWDTAVEYAQAA